jgi:hypothetical protein
MGRKNKSGQALDPKKVCCTTVFLDCLLADGGYSGRKYGH